MRGGGAPQTKIYHYTTVNHCAGALVAQL